MVPTQAAIFGLRVLAAALGFLLLYGAFFLYPDERKAVKNRADDLWKGLRALQDRAIAGEPTFIRWIAETTQRGFVWLLGEPLSKKFFIVSGLLSMTSFALTMSVFGDFGWAVPTGLLIFAVATAFWVLYFGRIVDKSLAEFDRAQREQNHRLADLVRSLQDVAPSSAGDNPKAKTAADNILLPKLHDRLQTPTPWQQPLSYSAPARSWKSSLWQDTLDSVLPFLYPALFASPTILLLAGAKKRGVGPGIFFSAITSSFACDILAILITMVVLEKLKNVKNGFFACGWLLLNGIAVAAMLGIPFVAYMRWVNQSSPLGRYLLFVASANISTAAPAAAYLLLAVGLLLHRLFWPLLLRPLYNLIDGEKFSSPKILGSAGVALLLAAWPHFFKPLDPIVKALTELF